QRFRDHGLAVYGTFVFGYDADDRRVVEESVAFAREQRLFLAAFNHLVPFPGTPLYARLRDQGRLLTEKWWLDPNSRVGDVTFRPKKMAPDELQELCLEARRRFYSWGSIAERLWDRQANAQSPHSPRAYPGLNLATHFDIDRRQGLNLGAGKISAVEFATASAPVASAAKLARVPGNAGSAVNSGEFRYES